MAHILLIDDDPEIIAEQLKSAFVAPEHRLEVAHCGADGVELVRHDPPDVILLDLRLPDGSVLEVYRAIRAVDARIPIIFVTVSKTADSAINAMKQGAFDYLQKPLNLSELRRVVGEALDVAKRMRSRVVLNEPVAGDDDGAMFGSSRAMLEIYKAIGRVAAQDVTVLITGESGTGKELVARAIYQHSSRAKTPFFALNCAAIPENLLESELFGHEKGAFTGADRRRIGRFEQCSGGTILLDEIGDMPLALQAKILRVLQEHTFERVGGSETIRADVRIIAATHRDLGQRANEERFRSDLYYRLGVFTIHLPPLRDRSEDLPGLVRYYLRRFGCELGREVRDIAPEAMDLLQQYHWPGNVRELQSVLKQALLHASGNVLLPAFLPDLRWRVDMPERAGVGDATVALGAFIGDQLSSEFGDLYSRTHDEVDRILFTRVLDRTRGNRREAARLLGISRQTMRVKLRALGMQVTYGVETLESQPPDQSSNGCRRRSRAA
ncbi:MAG TPA: sigma-54 dependent transcriptional regulator [Polyangiaceae bacterium]|jgi:DNA-binding NtrC family response regulator|nr:sigma-54 dependent transcriptional regulator [Polyangiaceae bacterium]